MNLLQRSCLFILAPLAGVGALGFHEGLHATPARAASATASATAHQDRLVDQPSEWVSLSAEYKRIHERDGSVFVGHQYRNSDGSTRNESGRSFDDIDLIAIKNVPEAKFYSWNSEQGWTSQPMVLPPSGWIPLRRSYSQGMVDVSDTVEGFRLVRFETNGRVVFQAPELNLFTLITLVKCQSDVTKACGTWYSSIKLGEPPVDFSPPKGVRITELKEPGGIVFTPAQ